MGAANASSIMPTSAASVASSSGTGRARRGGPRPRRRRRTRGGAAPRTPPSRGLGWRPPSAGRRPQCRQRARRAGGGGARASKTREEGRARLPEWERFRAATEFTCNMSYKSRRPPYFGSPALLRARPRVARGVSHIAADSSHEAFPVAPRRLVRAGRLPAHASSPRRDARVSTAAELREAISTAGPGTEIVMADGEWADVRIRFVGTGTADAPITLRAETPGGVVVRGASDLWLAGEHLVVDGLHFRDGAAPGDALIQFAVSDDSLANHSRVTNCVVDGLQQTAAGPDGPVGPVPGAAQPARPLLPRGQVQPRPDGPGRPRGDPERVQLPSDLRQPLRPAAPEGRAERRDPPDRRQQHVDDPEPHPRRGQPVRPVQRRGRGDLEQVQLQRVPGQRLLSQRGLPRDPARQPTSP